MSQSRFSFPKKGSLRQRILASVGAMVLLSLLSSTVSLYRMTGVNQLLRAINHFSVPLGRLSTQMQSDAQVYFREFERSLGNSHWKDPHWKPRPAPGWIEEVLTSEMARVVELTQDNASWQEWAKQMSKTLERLSQDAAKLHSSLLQKDEATSLEIYSKWISEFEDWRRQLQWGNAEFERSLRQDFAVTEERVTELRATLEMILAIVVIMSLLLLWLGEQALRPLEELAGLARAISRRGLRKEDKSLLPEIPISRSDEVSQLSREFHHMATALLEREKTVESQKNRLWEQNRLLREMNELKNLAAIGRMSAQVAHEVRNPLHSIGLEAEMAIEMASKTGNVPLKQSLQSILGSVDRLQKITENYLKLSRLSSGQKSLVDLGELVESVLAIYSPVCEAQRVRVILNSAAGLNLRVWVDRELLEQVLGNLLRNSLQALENETEGRIVLHLGISSSDEGPDEGKVFLRIEDNGPGIPPEIKERLFNPFVTTRAQGTGLGLSFIKKVLEDHGGTIVHVDRRPVDGKSAGACFEFTLPVVAQPVEAQNEKLAPSKNEPQFEGEMHHV